MAIVIRLKKIGTKNKKKWRVVVTDRRTSRDGRLIEEIGFYNSLVNPPVIHIQRERYEAWVRKGARPSDTVRSLVQKKNT